MLRGRYDVRVDDKGRIKLPAAFRGFVESNYDRKFFVTSVTGQSARLYPLKVWAEIEAQLLAQPVLVPVKRKFVERTSYYGQVADMDSQGRLVIPPSLRKSAELSGEVIVIGNGTYMEVWLHERFQARLNEQPFTEADEHELAQHYLK